VAGAEIQSLIFDVGVATKAAIISDSEQEIGKVGKKSSWSPVFPNFLFLFRRWLAAPPDKPPNLDPL